MKYIIIIAALLFISCKEDKCTDTKEEVTQGKDTIASPGQGNTSALYIKDRSLYSPEWLAAIEKSGYNEPLKVIDNYILIDKDTTYFPEELKLNAGYHLTAFTDKHFYQLDITRINLTTLEYDFTLMENEKAILKKNGKAHLGALFFIGGESFTDDLSGDEHLGSEYYDESSGSCFAIVVADKDEQQKINAVVNFCDNSKPDAPLNKDITLRQSL
jgi:hypothetical protein